MTEKELIGKVHSAVYHQCQRRQSAQTLIHHAPDAGVRTENWLKTLLLLLQAVGCKKEKWAGTQAGDSATVQQKRKSGN